MSTSLVAAPTYAANVFPSLLYATATAPKPVVKPTVEALRSLDVQGHAITLESAWSHALYAGLEFDAVWHAEKTTPFWTFVHTRGIDVIVIDTLVRDSPRFRGDPEFEAFLDSADHREDFRMVPVRDTNVVLAVRERAMPARRGR